MTDQENSLTIAEQIDVDEGLKSKSKQLTVISLILLALSFSGAKVEEANTFILKLKFENQEGISVLLVFALLFLLLRYYNYACKYHQQLYINWSTRLLRDSFFSHALDSHGYEYGGVIHEVNSKVDIDALRYEGCEYKCTYKCEYIFIRRVVYNWYDESNDDYREEEVNISKLNYVKALRLEAKYQLDSFIKHRENLDIIAPYILGILAISSYFFNGQLQFVLKILSVN